MNKKGIRMVKISTAIIILGIAGYLAYLPLNKKPQPPQPIPAKVPLENENKIKQHIPIQALAPAPQVKEIRNVSPVYGLDSLIDDYTDDIAKDALRTITYQEERNRFLAMKRQGQTFWQSEKWMKEPEYYRNLDTALLAEECFEKPIFYLEMGAYDDPVFGFMMLEIFHNGFAELFQRDDMWKGILHTYQQASEKISYDYDFKTTMRQSMQLGGLRDLYSYPPFKKQLEGHEQEFLDANIAAINKFITYLDTYDPKKNGSTSDEAPFSHGPCSVIEVAMMLTKQLNPQKYARIERAVKSIRWKRKQTVADVRQYLELVAGYLDEN